MNFRRPLHVLQFGTSGQLASELLRAASPETFIISAVPRAEADFCEPFSVMHPIANREPIDIVVNAVGYTGVDKAENDYAMAENVNAIAPGLIAQECSKRNIPLIHVSTDYVFDGTKPTAYVETDPVAPLNAYGRTKVLGEDLIRAACPQHIIVRTSWVYAASGANFVRTILRLAASRDEIRVVDDQWGNPTAAMDLACAILLIMQRIGTVPLSHRWGTFHYAGGGAVNWYAFAKAILEEAAKSAPMRARILPIPSSEYSSAAKRPKHSMLDCTKIESAYGIAPRPWMESMRAVVRQILVR